ncbi:Polysaccharide deacetylase [Verrucomicrobium sp. GAS474]|uniref:polysaccharide deacetylase family protein n=1 Tax=Verrucomicrobium sp. GAS474 TaxID=1882831 RepID=UPI00087C22B8|nr:polysaccharide deacetylase family protein [Verrucomicrobium sp. GAS474]SDU05861.1 Polysaccharide deacetylase [Verrucomicrobium sp. GAS474]
MEPRIEIPAFPQGKRIAVTLSFDDGHTFDRKVVAALNRLGLKATFNLNSGKLGRTGEILPDGYRNYLDASEVADLYRGHEVAIHTVTHPFLDRLDVSQLAYEVLDDRRNLEGLVGYPVRGMAYPFGVYDQKIADLLRGLGVAYSRTTRTEEKCFPPEDPLKWATTAHQFASEPTVPQRFEKLYAQPRYSVFFVWGHGFEFHDRNDWDALDRLFAPLSGKPDVWYCTNIELFDYEAARSRLVIAANLRSVLNPSALPVTLAVDGKLREVPPGLTLL